jgi:hypothetical protein
MVAWGKPRVPVKSMIQPGPHIPPDAGIESPVQPGTQMGPMGVPYGLLRMLDHAELVTEAPRKPEARRPSFFAEGGTGRHIAGIIGDALAGAAGRPAVYAPAVQQARTQEAARERWEAEQSLAERRLRQPQFANIPNVGYVAVDPETGASRVVQPSRSDGEAYADSLGFERGSPQYVGALTDYALRSYGPTAIEDRGALEEDRQAAALERLERSLDLQATLADVRDRTARRGQDLTNSRGIRGQDMTDARGRGSAGYQGRGRGRGGRAGPTPTGRTASGPGGRRVRQMSDGSWVPIIGAAAAPVR